MNLPPLFYWKKGLVLIGTLVSALIFAYLCVQTGIAVYLFVNDQGYQIRDYWVTIVYGILFLGGLIGESIGFVSAVRNHRALLKLYMVYSILYYLYLLVDILYVSRLPENYPKLYQVANNEEHSLLNQSSAARLFWALLWDIVVVLYYLDLRRIDHECPAPAVTKSAPTNGAYV